MIEKMRQEWKKIEEKKLNKLRIEENNTREKE